MKLRSSVAAFVALALTMEMPVTAGAQEIPAPSAASADAPADAPADAFADPPAPAIMTHIVSVLPVAGSLDGTLRLAARPALPASLGLFASRPDEIRLSHGAKIAIIVTAIVVGSLIVLGAVIVSRPGHL